RPILVPYPLGAVDHGPLVQAETPGQCGPGGGRRQQPAHPPDGVDALEELSAVDRHALRTPRVARPSLVRWPSGEHSAKAGVPPEQLRRAERVVGEQEVVHRVWLAPLPALEMR